MVLKNVLVPALFQQPSHPPNRDFIRHLAILSSHKMVMAFADAFVSINGNS